MTFDDAAMLAVFVFMYCWVFGMFWFFGPGGDERWCNHSVRRECESCRRRRGGVDK